MMKFGEEILIKNVQKFWFMKKGNPNQECAKHLILEKYTDDSYIKVKRLVADL